MALFNKGTTGFTYCCGARYVPKGTTWKLNPGVLLSLEKPFEEETGEECVTIETSFGNIYLRLVKEHKNTGANPNWVDNGNGNPAEFHDKIQWYHIADKYSHVWDPETAKSKQTFLPTTRPGVGVLINSIPRATVKTDEICRDFGKALIYRSPPFFNAYHYERPDPSLELLIFEVKEKENEVQTRL